MTTDTHRILIGSLGWQHLAWQESFYPEDLPVDWRLGYYVNEFPLAVVTSLEQELSEDLYAEIEECGDRLSLLIAVELDPAADPRQPLADACEFARQLGEVCIGLLLQCNPDSFSEPQLLLNRLRDCPVELPLCLDAQQPLSDVWREQLASRGIGWSWNRYQERDGLAVGPLGVIVISGDCSARDLRERVEAALQQAGQGRRMALVFAGDPPAVEQMRQTKTIEELL